MDLRNPGQNAGSGPKADPAVEGGEAPFWRLLDTLPVAAYTCDTEGLITYYNRHAIDVWGREPTLNDPVDRFCGSFKLYHLDGTPMDHENCWMGLALRTGEDCVGREILIEKPNGDRAVGVAHVNLIRDEGGKLLGAVNVIIDITDRKRVEEELAQGREELERRVEARTAELEALTRELESFNYSVSHDLRAPLRGIEGFSRALEEDCADHLTESAREHLQRIRGGVRRMSGLIDDLLGLAHVTQGRLRKREVDLTALAKSVLRELLDAQPGRSVTTRIAEGVTAVGDPGLLRVALENLLGNAMKFTRGRSDVCIEFGTVATADEPIYLVRDNGAGFDMRYADRIFAPFQRLHAGAEFDGTGIGLAIVQRVVRRHGGRMWAESEVGEGATFFFTLPATG